ncbi:Uncharacterised protein [Corynebacterium kutscheri]|uniref:Uncharacterized protein n=1 Tax=Corynebacterium kutscheri TaxID=35755 RepID=A0AB38VXW0_9CORY|nr:hypothetical protein [Corynebacterium kutscheri]VEH06982.1 Uncharacterised protein [Corynebacterium kutscheri]VEH79477.1 Uncharacterised protein [Corynebacterium kutscheri]
MSDFIADLLGVNPVSDEAKLAQKQLDSDMVFLDRLISERRKNFPDLVDFSKKVGASLERLEAFESDPLDFDLMFIRQYAHALNLLVLHEVVPGVISGVEVDGASLEYRARVMVADLFRKTLEHDDRRAKLMEDLDVDKMPVIIPALGNTLASNIHRAACRYFEQGDEYVLVPVCLPAKDPGHVKLYTLIFSPHKANTFWQINASELHDSVTMDDVVTALDSSKKWDVREIDAEQLQEFKDLAGMA